MKKDFSFFLPTVVGCIGLLAPALGLADLPASSAAPPPPRVEHAPPHRDGYAWAPGYWA